MRDLKTMNACAVSGVIRDRASLGRETGARRAGVNHQSRKARGSLLHPHQQDFATRVLGARSDRDDLGRPPATASYADRSD
jgi:hypothetical protein